MLNTAYRGSDFFTESKNFDPLSSTGLSKLPPLRVFMRKITNFSIFEKLYIIWNKKSHKTTSRAARWPKLAILANFGAWKLSAKKPKKKCQKKRDFFSTGRHWMISQAQKSVCTPKYKTSTDPWRGLLKHHRPLSAGSKIKILAISAKTPKFRS